VCGHCLFNVTGEVAIEQGRRTARFGGGDEFGEQATGASGNGGTHNRHGTRFVLDDDFRAQADVRHQPGEVAGCIGFRDADHCHTHDDTSILHPIDEDLLMGTPFQLFPLAAKNSS
jgi:hypothetical protein